MLISTLIQQKPPCVSIPAPSGGEEEEEEEEEGRGGEGRS